MLYRPAVAAVNNSSPLVTLAQSTGQINLPISHSLVAIENKALILRLKALTYFITPNHPLALPLSLLFLCLFPAFTSKSSRDSLASVDIDSLIRAIHTLTFKHFQHRILHQSST